MKLLETLERSNLIHPPKWLVNNTAYMVVMGSHAYGVNSSDSDFDVYGFCLPPLDMIFPHLSGEIPGFGTQIQRFDVWSEHHIRKPNSNVEYDFSIYGIVKYFQLCMENNPNMIDSLFVPDNCVMSGTNGVGLHVRANRKKFLHKGSWHKFKGYAYSQISKIKNKTNSSNPKRAETIQKYGYDVKFAYHIVRLLNEVEQILVEGDLDLLRNNEQLKSIRRGEWTLEQIENYFVSKESILEASYANSTLRHSPDEKEIKKILMECIEMKYGSISLAHQAEIDERNLLNDLQHLLKKYV